MIRRGQRSPVASLGARILFLAACATLVPSREARADWLITPWIATTFAIDTTFLTLETGARDRQYAMFGVSGSWLGSQLLGVEGEFAAAPGFFEVDETGNPLDNLYQASHLVTVFGNVLVATPLSVSGDSLRPYLLGGLGWVRAVQEDQIGLASIDDSSLGLQLGGGAIGFVSNRLAVRFDLRNIRTLSRGTNVRGERDWKLSFWRASIGVAIRY
jgi:opacity protein-like surface antigen